MTRHSVLRRQAPRALGLGRSRPVTSLSTCSPSERGQHCHQPRISQASWHRRLPTDAYHPLSLFTSPSSTRWFSSEKKKQSKKKVIASEDADGAPTAEEPPPPTATEAPKEATTATEDDDCPPWQNPLHHNNPDMQTKFEEDLAPGEEMKYQPLPPMEDPNDPDKVLASQEVYDLADEIVHLSMLEMKELIDKIGDHFGYEKPPFAGPGGAGAAVDEEEGDEGEQEAAAAKTAFDLKLVGFDAKSKIKVIKEVRALANLGLKEAKELVEGAPKTVLKDISKEQAEELAKKLEEVGATVEVV